MIHSQTEPPNQLTLFGAPQERNPKEGQRRKQIAIAEVAEATPLRFREECRQVVEKLAETGTTFTTDDVWLALSPEDKPQEMRAIGPIMVSAKRDGLIVATGQYKPSDIPECHRRPKALWQGVAAA